MDNERVTGSNILPFRPKPKPQMLGARGGGLFADFLNLMYPPGDEVWEPENIIEQSVRRVKARREELARERLEPMKPKKRRRAAAESKCPHCGKTETTKE